MTGKLSSRTIARDILIATFGAIAALLGNALIELEGHRNSIKRHLFENRLQTYYDLKFFTLKTDFLEASQTNVDFNQLTNELVHLSAKISTYFPNNKEAHYVLRNLAYSFYLTSGREEFRNKQSKKLLKILKNDLSCDIGIKGIGLECSSIADFYNQKMNNPPR